MASSVALKNAKKSRVLHLNGLALRTIPSPVFDLTVLLRLDLGFNKLLSLSSEIGRLTHLEQLWLNDNYYLASLPTQLESCKKLKVLDIRRTAVRELPREIGRLKNLVEIDLEGTPLGESSGRTVLDTDGVIEELARVDRRENLRLEMLEKVCAGVYREVADSPEGQILIPAFVQAVVDAFSDDLDQLRNVVRNCDRLFPGDLNQARNPARAAKLLKDRFIALVRDTAKVKMSAELELKMRALYYDKIEPESVEGHIRGIYNGDWAVERPLELEDIEFLIKNAPRLFPPNPEDITGPGIRKAVWDLQDTLIAERKDVVDKLFTSLSNSLYPDREPAEVRDLAAKVGRLFEVGRFATKKELEEMKKLAADASQHFPAEFHAALSDISRIKASFRAATSI